MRGLPILITIPHGGTKIPKEVVERTRLDAASLDADRDPFAREIFALAGVEVVTTNIAHCVVDPDGIPNGKAASSILKTHTRNNMKVYKAGQFPQEQLANLLIKRYYEPFHRKILRILTSSHLELALNCRIMGDSEFNRGTKPSESRPMICLSNLNGETCGDEWMRTMATCVQKEFELEENMVACNHPETGASIIRKYANRPIPWIQVSISQDLYLTEPWFNREKQEMAHERLDWLNKAFGRAVSQFIIKTDFSTPRQRMATTHS